MMNIARKLFAKDIDNALREAREQERSMTRAECEKDKQEALERLRGELTLEVKKKEAELKHKPDESYYKNIENLFTNL